MKSKPNQFVKLPKKHSGEDITAKDQVIYLYLRKYMNNTTKDCFPSLATLKQETKAGETTIKKSIAHLAELGYIEIIPRPGQTNLYKFNEEKLKQFEKFSYEFLSNPKLNFRNKCTLIASQQYMILHPDTKQGLISYSYKKQSELTGISDKTLKRSDSDLKKLGLLTVTENKSISEEMGFCRTQTRTYELGELGQTILFTLGSHEKQINANTEDIQQLKQRNKDLVKQVEQLTREVHKLASMKKVNNSFLTLD